MGGDPDREPPFFFSKPADALVLNGVEVPYPPRTQNLHFELELVVALGEGGCEIPTAQAAAHIFGYAIGNDLTRRDLQAQAKKAGRPWDTAKGFDYSAPISDIIPLSDCGELTEGEIRMEINGEVCQRSDLSQMIWNVNEIISELSTLYTLHPGDLIYTGTPAGVGAILPGDEMVGVIEGVGELRNKIKN